MILRKFQSIASSSFVALLFSLSLHPLFSQAAVLDCKALFSVTSDSDSSSSKTWFSKISFSGVENILINEKVVKAENLKVAMTQNGKRPSGTTVGMLRLTFADGTMAIWKPGTWSPMGEVTAYKAARLVGSRLVPPTVLRTFDAEAIDHAKIDSELAGQLIGKTGSIQFFVETPIDLLNMNKEQRQTLWAQVPENQKNDRNLFNFVFGQWDLHWGNLLVDESKSIVSIDNSAIRNRQMVRYGELPYLRKFSFYRLTKNSVDSITRAAFPFDHPIILKNPSKADFTSLVKNFVEPLEIERFWHWRKDSADNTMNIIFWDNAIWIQAIGYSNYGPIRAGTVYSDKTLDYYRALTPEKLREVFPNKDFSDDYVREILDRRNQIISAIDDAAQSP
ncbi:MAG: hypothetical protein H7061_04440 [Bdellovibrionaceae bacterium]|nr:hypothetical protein [Bdellovibrio sp.]